MSRRKCTHHVARYWESRTCPSQRSVCSATCWGGSRCWCFFAVARVVVHSAGLAECLVYHSKPRVRWESRWTSQLPPGGQDHHPHCRDDCRAGSSRTIAEPDASAWGRRCRATGRTTLIAGPNSALKSIIVVVSFGGEASSED